MPSAVEAAIRGTVTQGLMKLAAFNRARLKPPAEGHPFLRGAHAPMTQELTLTGLQVSGQIPPQLNGWYLRIGPNPVRPPQGGAHHWFLGDGMVHGIRLQGGQALWYRNRWVRSSTVSRTLGELPAPGPRGPSDTVNTNVIGHAGRLWALVEAGGFPVELDGELNTLAHNPFDGSLGASFSAHPHRCPRTGELHAICYDGPVQDRIRHVVVGTEGRVVRDEPIAVRDGPSVHDCMITARHVLVFDLPVTFSMKALVKGLGFPYAWNPAHPARVGLLPREGRGSEVRWFEVDPCYVFHPCNAFEQADGSVVVDVVAHETMFDTSTYGPDARATHLERWLLPADGGRVQRRVLDATAQEFPRMDERRLGQPYRYAYAVEVADNAAVLFGPRLLRHDLTQGTRSVRDFGPGAMCSEFVFVPRSAQGAEDDGWLMGLVVYPDQNRSELVILNADDFAGAPQAVVHLPHRVPTGFHGNWVDA